MFVFETVYGSPENFSDYKDTERIISSMYTTHPMDAYTLLRSYSMLDGWMTGFFYENVRRLYLNDTHTLFRTLFDYRMQFGEDIDLTADLLRDPFMPESKLKEYTKLLDDVINLYGDDSEFKAFMISEKESMIEFYYKWKE